MKIRKKTLTTGEAAVLSSLSESYMLLPFMIFSALFSGTPFRVSFFIPVVIIYSIERACLIGLRGFGEISNPYRIMRAGLFIALSGAILIIASFLYTPLLMISALLVGTGLAPLRAMFIPLFSSLTAADPSLRKAKGLGTILYFAIMTAALTLGKLTLPVIPVLFLFYIAYSISVIMRLDGDSLFEGRSAFDTSKSSPAFFAFGILALLSLLILRQYQMSGVSVLMWLTPVTVVAFVTIELIRRRHYKDYSFQTYWIGGVKSFIMLYSLVYHTSVGNSSMAMYVYLAIAFSSIVAGPVGKLLKGRLSCNACIMLSSVFAFLLTLPSETMTILGIVLSGLFANIAAAVVGRSYMGDERYVPEERALVRIRIQTTGSIIEQLVLFFTIYVIGEYRLHENLLEPYAAGLPDPGISLKLRFAGFISASLLFVIAVLITCFAGRKKK